MRKENKSEDNEEMLNILYYDFNVKEASLQELASCDINLSCYTRREMDAMNDHSYILHFGGMVLKPVSETEYSIHSNYD